MLPAREPGRYEIRKQSNYGDRTFERLSGCCRCIPCSTYLCSASRSTAMKRLFQWRGSPIMINLCLLSIQLSGLPCWLV